MYNEKLTNGNNLNYVSITSIKFINFLICEDQRCPLENSNGKVVLEVFCNTVQYLVVGKLKIF